MPIIGLSYLVAILFAIHAVKTGRDNYWLFILLAFPGIGAIIYFFAEVLPELQGGSRARKFKKQAVEKLPSNKAYDLASARLAKMDTMQNKLNFADENYKLERFSVARELYQECLTGAFQHDPDILINIANCHAALDDHVKVIATIDRLREQNPEYEDAEMQVLYDEAEAALEAV